MVNRLLRPKMPQRVVTEPHVRVYNASGIKQGHGTYELLPGEWTSIPHDLAMRLSEDQNYIVEGMTRRRLRRAVDIIIPVHNQLPYLKKCLDSIRLHTDHFGLIAVDDGSEPEVGRWMAEQEFDSIIRHEQPMGFSRSCNAGIAVSKAPYVCLLNSDTVVAPHWLSVMLSVAALGFDIVGPTTCHSSGIQCDHSIAPKRHDMGASEIFRLGDDRLREHLTAFKETEVYGFCLLVSRRVVERIGGFDWVRYRDGYYEDTDYVWRAQQAGFASAWAKGSYVHHFGCMSFTDRIGMEKVKALSDRNNAIFEKRKKQTRDLYFDLGRKC